MGDATDLKSGDKIEIILNKDGEDVEFLSKVEEINDNDTFAVSRPISKDGYIHLPLGQAVRVIFFRENGIYYFNSEAVEVIKNNATFSVMMRILSGIHKLQRRNYYRLRTLVPVKVSCEIDDEDINMECNTADISGGGMKILSLKRFDRNIILKVFIKIPGIESQQILGKVVRCLPSERNTAIFEIGIEFIDINLKTRQSLLKYIFRKQREIIKRIRFLNDGQHSEI